MSRYKQPSTYKHVNNTQPTVPESPNSSKKRVGAAGHQNEVLKIGSLAHKNENALSGMSTYSFKSGPKDSFLGPWDHKIAS